MPNAEQALIQYEAGQTVSPQTALTNSGDNVTFTSGVSPWSGVSGFEPDVRPDGLLTGGGITATLNNDEVSAAAATVYLAGASVNVAADATLTVSRGTAPNENIVNSITVDSAGTYVVVAGTAGAAASLTRGAAGGPPFIPVGDIEVGQVILTSETVAVVLSSEIQSINGLSREESANPGWTTDSVSGQISFFSALPLIHTGSVPKGVFSSFATPIFADIAKSSDFVPSDESVTITSTQIYGTTLGSSSKAIANASFTLYGENGITDPVITLAAEGANIWTKFFQDRLKAPYVLTQGVLGMTRAFPAGDNITASMTQTPEVKSRNVAA